MKTLTDGKVDGQALEDVLREMVNAEGVQDPGRDAEEEQQVTRILLLLASLPHTGRQWFLSSSVADPRSDPDFYQSRIQDLEYKNNNKGGGRRKFFVLSFFW